VLSTDLGAQDLPIPTDGLIAAVQAIKRQGVSDADIDLMIRKNPARLLGLAD
jgi:predicted metal-dependent phosphotriesterase family hydrolase